MTRWALVLMLLFRGPQLWSQVRVNEVSFDPVVGTTEWVELFNRGPTPVSVNGWVLTDFDVAAGNEAVLSVPVDLPPNSYLIVYMDATGINDLDFTDGTGVVYTGTATTVSLAATEDELGLFVTLPLSTGTLIDFVAWVTDGDYNGAADGALAVAAGIWTTSAAVVATDVGSGYSIGRTSDGVDSDGTADFSLFRAPNPGLSNESVRSSFPDVLTVESHRRVFTPRAADVTRQSVPLSFRVSSSSIVKSIKIFDTRGRLVHRLMEGDQSAGENFAGRSNGVVPWNGLSDDATTAAPGLYIVALEGADPDRGTVERGRTWVAIAEP